MAHAEDWQRLHLEDLAACLNTLADALSVTSSALRWRLVALGKLRPVQAGAIPEAALRNNGRPTPPGDLPDLFSEQFMDVLGRAIGQGSVSVHRIGVGCGKGRKTTLRAINVFLATCTRR